MPNFAPRQAIILAAGMGRRLENRDARPKALVEIHGRSILARALAALAQHGAPRVTIVVGHHGERIVEHVASLTPACPVEIVWNREFATTDSAHSLWCARDALVDGAIVMNGDVLFADHVLAATRVAPEESTWLATPTAPGDDGWMLALDADRRVVRLEAVPRGTAAIDAAFFKSAGILSLSAQSGRKLAGWLDRAVGTGRTDRHFDDVLRRHLPEIELTGAVIDRAAWAEIDEAADLRRARTLFSPLGCRDGNPSA